MIKAIASLAHNIQGIMISVDPDEAAQAKMFRISLILLLCVGEFRSPRMCSDQNGMRDDSWLILRGDDILQRPSLSLH